MVQPYWSKKLKDFPKDQAVVLEDTHLLAAFGDQKPDVVGYLANKPRSLFHIGQRRSLCRLALFNVLGRWWAMSRPGVRRTKTASTHPKWAI